MPEEDIHAGIFLFCFSQSTDNNDGYVGIYLTDKADKVRAGRFRHDVIGDDHADLLGIRKAAEEGKCAVGTGSDLYLESGLAQH